MPILDRLDPGSRRTVHFLMSRLLVILLAPLSLLGSERPFDAYVTGVLLLCVFCGVLASGLALNQGDQPGAPTLNYWDEVVAYCAVAALARAAAWIHG